MNARLLSILKMMVMVMMVVIMARVMRTQMHDHAVMMVMVMMVVMAELHGNLRDLFGRAVGEPRIVGL